MTKTKCAICKADIEVEEPYYGGDLCGPCEDDCNGPPRISFTVRTSLDTSSMEMDPECPAVMERAKQLQATYEDPYSDIPECAEVINDQVERWASQHYRECKRCEEHANKYFF